MHEGLNGQLVRTLLQKELSCTVAESCTGGLVAAAITDVPGASGEFKGGVVSYTNEIKQNVLGVSPQTLASYSAISAQTALEMAAGVRKLMAADIAASVTGNAGPQPSEGKPVGMVFVAVDTVAFSRVVELEAQSLGSTRSEIRSTVVRRVLELLLAAAEEL